MKDRIIHKERKNGFKKKQNGKIYRDMKERIIRR